MPELTVRLNIPAAELVRFYRGQAQVVKATAVTGEIVQFPAAALRRHVTADGIHGLYRLAFDPNHKFIGLEPVMRQ